MEPKGLGEKEARGLVESPSSVDPEVQSNALFWPFSWLPSLTTIGVGLWITDEEECRSSGFRELKNLSKLADLEWVRTAWAAAAESMLLIGNIGLLIKFPLKWPTNLLLTAPSTAIFETAFFSRFLNDSLTSSLLSSLLLQLRLVPTIGLVGGQTSSTVSDSSKSCTS